MTKCLFRLTSLFVLNYIQTAVTLSIHQLESFCSNPDAIGIIGGSHRRLVTEGGRITLTCCLPGTSNGHDHEQLVWLDPRGKEITNHFTTPIYRNQHSTYSVPDFRSAHHLVTMLVIQNFQLEDTGGYTCRKANLQSNVKSATVLLDQRPRLLADYHPLPPSTPEDSGAAIVAGPPVFVALEEGLPGKIACRINPNNPKDSVHLTWYFQGRQLVAPAFYMSMPDLGSPKPHFGNPNQYQNIQLTPEEIELTRIATENEILSKRYDMAYGRPVSVDPAELGIRIVADGQVLQMDQVDSRHSGIFLCKAEAQNPTWSPENSFNDPPSTETGVIESPVLVQLQAIRGIVFTPPRMLPGSPTEVPVLQPHNRPLYGFKRRAVRDQSGASSYTDPSMYLMQTPSKDKIFRPQQVGGPQSGKGRPVTPEGGQLVLECQARGKPSPQLLWYRGGMGTNILTDSKAFTFDQRIKEALQHMSLKDIQPQLGIMIANSEQLLPAIAGIDAGKYEEHRFSSSSSTSAGPLTFGKPRQDQLDRFELTVSIRKDDKEEPVITVSRLTINQLRPSDATRYTCLALLDLSHYGGKGNYTDVGSVFPEVILKPRFIKSGTHLQADGFPGQNATLTCEAFGGLSNPGGLRLRFLRGTGIPDLINFLSRGEQSKGENALKTGDYKTDLPTWSTANEDTDQTSLTFRPTSVAGEPNVPMSIQSSFSTVHDYETLFGNKSVEPISPETDARYQLTLTSDSRNPYISLLKLEIKDLRPSDNAYYACEALSGPHWRALAPTAHDGPGRLTVWFPPTDVKPRNVIARMNGEGDALELGTGLMYGLPHQPSKLSCQAAGQPTPTWTWTGPETGPNVYLGDPDGPKGYQKVDYQDGELSISELTVAAGYWNVGLFGTYVCTASNRLGVGIAHLRLKMATHPSRPFLRACKVEAKMIELCVEPPTDTGGLPLTHYELRIQTHPRGAFYGPFVYLPGRRLLRLPHLNPGYYYRFAVSAVSPAGRGPNAYLEVTTNRLSKPVIKILTDPKYIEPTAYNLHWEATEGNGQQIEQYTVNIRPVDVDYSMGEIAGKPTGDWKVYSPITSTCEKEDDQPGTKTVCQYRVDKLQPDSTYELELDGRNSAGFTEAQRIIFRTSPLSGGSGQMINIPSYLRHSAGNNANILQTYSFLVMLFFVLQTTAGLFGA